MGTVVLPEYVSSEQKEREAFLSQLGTFSPNERELFHRLCRMWTGQIAYGYVISMTENDLPNVKNDLISLMQKLRQQRVGILKTNLTDGVRVSTHVILCNRDDSTYYINLSDELLLDVIDDINIPLPTVESLEKQGLVIPSERCVIGNYPELAQIYADSSPREPILYRIPCPDANYEFLISSASIKRFLTITLAKLQGFFQNPNFLAAVAQLRSSSVMELRKQLSAKDPLFWHELVTFILAVSKDLQAFRKITLDPQLFQICHFLKQFLNEQMVEQKKRRDAEQERITDLKAICERVRSSIDIVLSEKDFSESLLFYKPKYQDDFPAFKEAFQKNCMEAPTGKNLAIISRIGHDFIHMDNVQSWFIQQISRYSKELLTIYVKAMELFVKHPNDVGFEYFYSSSNFNDDIMLRIRNNNSALADLFDRPNLIAEAIIHSAKKQKDLRSPEEMKALLAPYLFTDRIRFKPIAVIMGLKIVDIYRLAYMRVSIIRQLILKFSGRHESFIRKFNGFMMDDDSSLMGEGSSISTRTVTDPAPKKRKESNRPKEQKVKTESTTSKIPKKIINNPNAHNYSSKERDAAWQEFQRNLKK